MIFGWAVSSNSRDLRFESSPRQSAINRIEKTKIEKKRPANGLFKEHNNFQNQSSIINLYSP